MKSILVLIASCTLAVSALAKLPALSDEAKTKAAEATALLPALRPVNSDAVR